MKNYVNGKTKKVLAVVSILVIIVVVIIVTNTCKSNYTHSEATCFTYDNITGQTIVTGPDADKYVHFEDYVDNTWSVDWDHPIAYGEGYVYQGIIDGKEITASKYYWDSIQRSRMPNVIFGYVYVGD